MTPYPAYTASGIEWLGQIPTHWNVVLLKRLLKAIKDGTHGTFERLEKGKSLLSAKNVFPDGIRIGDRESLISEADFDEIVKNGFPRKSDVLLTIVGTIGRAFVYNFDYPLAFQRSVAFLRFKSSINPYYYYYFFQTPYFIANLYSSAKTSAQSGVYMGDVVQILVLKIPTEEQCAIADYLDHKTRLIDTYLAQKQQQIERLQAYRTALINQAVTKGLNPAAPMKDSGIEWLGEIPAHWEVVGLTKYLESIVDYRGKTPEKVESGTFLVTARNIKNGKINYDLSQEYVRAEEYETIMQRGFPKKGDVLFTTEAPLGEAANVDREDIALAQRIIKFRSEEEYLDNYFLKYWILSHSFQSELHQYATGSTALGIKASKLNFLRLLLAPLPEQRNIVVYLDEQTARIDVLIAATQQQLDRLHAYRTALISDAVTGKMDVRNDRDCA